MLLKGTGAAPFQLSTDFAVFFCHQKIPDFSIQWLSKVVVIWLF